MKNINVFLFPHSSIPKDFLDKIPSSFFPINICKPWYMDMNLEKAERVNILFPDKTVKPPEGFLKLIEEYKRWAQEQGRENAFFAIFQQRFLSQEETPRHIKTLIKGLKEEVDKDKEDFINCHIILHLATEFEMSQYDIDHALKEMQKKDAPLLGIAEGASQSLEFLFKDVPDSTENPILDESILEEIIKAWIRLFGSYVDKNSALLTFNKQLFYFLKSRFEEGITESIIAKSEIPVKEETVEKTKLLKISFPEPIKRQDLINSFLSGKTLMCIIA